MWEHFFERFFILKRMILMISFQQSIEFYLNCLDLPDEAIYSDGPFDRPDMRIRRQVLKETVQYFKIQHQQLQQQALLNLSSWHSTSLEKQSKRSSVFLGVYRGDWGDVTAKLTRKFGQCFAVLNMANAYVPGGAYMEGAIAQEENMFRRSDCHFSVNKNQLISGRRYNDRMVDLISAKKGKVYLDIENPRICVRGPEKTEFENLGYKWLPLDEIFPFFELRSAAMDLRDGRPFDEELSKKIIRAQLETLLDYKVKHVVFGAHGCGAFRNPSERVAENYKEVIEEYRHSFEVIAFAIYHAGYGPDNYVPFNKCFSS